MFAMDRVRIIIIGSISLNLIQMRLKPMAWATNRLKRSNRMNHKTGSFRFLKWIFSLFCFSVRNDSCALCFGWTFNFPNEKCIKNVLKRRNGESIGKNKPTKRWKNCRQWTHWIVCVCASAFTTYSLSLLWFINIKSNPSEWATSVAVVSLLIVIVVVGSPVSLSAPAVVRQTLRHIHYVSLTNGFSRHCSASALACDVVNGPRTEQRVDSYYLTKLFFNWIFCHVECFRCLLFFFLVCFLSNGNWKSDTSRAYECCRQLQQRWLEIASMKCPSLSRRFRKRKWQSIEVNLCGHDHNGNASDAAMQQCKWLMIWHYLDFHCPIRHSLDELSMWRPWKLGRCSSPYALSFGCCAAEMALVADWFELDGIVKEMECFAGECLLSRTLLNSIVIRANRVKVHSDTSSISSIKPTAARPQFLRKLPEWWTEKIVQKMPTQTTGNWININDNYKFNFKWFFLFHFAPSIARLFAIICVL